MIWLNQLVYSNFAFVPIKVCYQISPLSVKISKFTHNLGFKSKKMRMLQFQNRFTCRALRSRTKTLSLIIRVIMCEMCDRNFGEPYESERRNCEFKEANSSIMRQIR